MSKFLISQYQSKIEKLIQHGGCKNEASIRRAFENLLDDYCKIKNYELIAELEYSSTRKDQDNNHPLSLISQGSSCPNLFIRCYI
jgi:hypothetical protein